MVCPIGHHQAFFAQDWGQQAANEVGTTELVSLRVHDLFDILRIHEKQSLGIQDAKISNELSGASLFVKSCKITARGFVEQSCPDRALNSSRKVAKVAEEEGLDENCTSDSANAGNHGETDSKKRDMEPRVGQARGEVYQKRDGRRKQDKVKVVRHDEISVLGDACQ